MHMAAMELIVNLRMEAFVSMQVNPGTLMLKLKAAYQVGVRAVIPYRHHHQIMRHPQDGEYTWLKEMLVNGRLVFADDLLDLLEFAIEGKP